MPIKRLFNFGAMQVEFTTDNADKKEALLQHALELFAEHGFDGTSVRMIADKAGMNVAMISYYFGSKEKMFEEMVILKTAHMRETLDSLLTNDKMDAWAKFQVLIDNYVDKLVSSKAHFHRIMMRELSLQKRETISKIIEERLMYNMKAVRQLMAEGVKEKVFRKEIDFGFIMSTMIGAITHTCSYTSLVERFKKAEGNNVKVTPESTKKWLKENMREMLGGYMLEQGYHAKALKKKKQK